MGSSEPSEQGQEEHSGEGYRRVLRPQDRKERSVFEKQQESTLAGVQRAGCQLCCWLWAGGLRGQGAFSAAVGKSWPTVRMGQPSSKRSGERDQSGLKG